MPGFPAGLQAIVSAFAKLLPSTFFLLPNNCIMNCQNVD
ncbi:hypothetical protein DBT_2006 [Dissulfuribacter thermophilus]|uniref:Uncharacterized protein n=1 Tax=Dissulfuribacter thermophilus TaxID=1156395 RepID=A0A1B9F4M4_9BACT|nr:hypothetical protein DBT_2006 [Dissulfuribacter thermophilus]